MPPGRLNRAHNQRRDQAIPHKQFNTQTSNPPLPEHQSLQPTDATVAKGAASLYAANMTTLALNIAHFIIIANLLLPLEIGTIAGLNLIILLFGTLATLSLQQATMRFIPEYTTYHHKTSAVKTLTISLALAAAVATSLATFLTLSAEPISQTLFRGEITPSLIYLATADAWTFTIAQVLLGALIGLNQIPKASAIQVISFLARYGAAAAFVIGGLRVFGAILGYLIGELLFLTLLAYYVARTFRSLPNNTNSHFSAAPLLRYSIPLLVSALIAFAIANMDKIFALLQLGLPELGIYNVAVAASLIASFAPSAITTALVPTLTSIASTHQNQEFKTLSKAYTRYIALLATPSAFGIAALSTALIQVFGTQYYPGAYPAAIMAVAIGTTAVSAVYSGQLLATKRTKEIMIANIIGLAVFTTSLALLVPQLQFTGAAYGRAIMTIAIAAAITFATYRQGNFVVDKKALLASIAASTVMALVLYFVVTTVSGYRRQIAALPILIPVGIIIYLTTLRLLRVFTRDDIDFLERLLPKKLKRLARWAGILAGVHSTTT